MLTGRFAPSPSGRMHLGNVFYALLAWLSVRSRGGRMLLRIEDLDPDRCRPEYAETLKRDLDWLGLDWDAEQTPQSRRTEAYRAEFDKLAALGLVYPCYCTRKELRQLAGAPHVDDVGAPYPGTCRHLGQEERRLREAQGRRACLRLRCPEGCFHFRDGLLGEQSFTLEDCGGDFALRRSDGVVAYQLAVALDDALMGITQVVRGRDILTSTPRQLALLRLTGAEEGLAALCRQAEIAPFSLQSVCGETAAILPMAPGSEALHRLQEQAQQTLQPKRCTLRENLSVLAALCRSTASVPALVQAVESGGVPVHLLLKCGECVLLLVNDSQYEQALRAAYAASRQLRD